MQPPPQQQQQPALRLAFRAVDYDVRMPAAGTKRRVLHGVSGDFVSGRLAAIMGPSGAGKSSLLDILAGVTVAGTVRGDVRINSEPRRPSTLGALECYLHQQDVLLPSATVREALLTSALLKLPRGIPRAEKIARVDELLQLLELADVADSLIGDATLGIKGISGGERRRVSVGVEMVKDPAIIFADEPTTGLDSEMALGVMRSLSAMAGAGKMVITTIHQPNSAITDLLDDFMLLARGHVLFAGAWPDAVPTFAGAGFACPLYSNPAEFFMALASAPDVIAVLAAAQAARSAVQDTATAAARSDVETGGRAQQPRPATQPRAATLVAVDYDVAAAAAASSLRTRAAGWADAAADFAHAVCVLTIRFARSWWRTPIMVAAEATQYAFLAVFLGLLYLRPSLALPDAPLDRMAAIFVVLTMLALIPSYTVVMMWDMERVLLRRETASRMYSRTAFFLAKTLTMMPIEVAQVTAFGAVTYAMFGLQASAAKFGVWWLTLVVFTLTGEALGYMCAIVTPNSKVGVELVSIILVLLLSFSGFLVRNVPVYFRWLARSSYVTFATAVLVENEFTGLNFAGPGGAVAVPGPSLIPAPMTTGLTLRANLAVLCGISVGTRVVCLLLLEVAARWHFL